MSEEYYCHVAGCPRGLKALITEFEDAVGAVAFMGTKMPEEHAEIEEGYRIARRNLETEIARKIEQAKKGNHYD